MTADISPSNMTLDEMSPFTKKQLNYLDEHLNERLREQKKDLIGGRQQYFRMRLASHILVTGIPIAILALLLTPIGDLLGIRLGWFSAPPGSSVAAGAAIQPKAVLESMRDLLTVIVPLFLGIAIWLVTIVAERRLKEYDMTLDKFRDSSGKAYDDFRKEIREAEDRIGKRVEDLVLAKVIENTKNSISELIDNTKKSFQTDTEDSRKQLNEMRDAIEERYGRLVDTASYVGHLTSISSVNSKLTELFDAGKNGDAFNLTLQLLDAFTRGRNDPTVHRPSGTLNDWFNLSAKLGQKDQEALALRVCLAGLEQQSGVPMPERIADWPSSLPPNYDLLAHAIKYAAEISAPELADLLDLSGYNAQTRQGRQDWTWRSYTFVMDGLERVGRADEAIVLAQAYLAQASIDPDQQKVVSNLAGIMSARGERVAAAQVLKDWLSAHPDLPAAQVVTHLIDWELGVAPPAQIIDWANRGIRDLAEKQPSANLGNLVYSRALAQDWQAYAAAARADRPTVTALAHAALNDYRLARQTEVNSSLYGQIDQRCKMLRALLVRFGDAEPDSAVTRQDDSDVPDEGAHDLANTANSTLHQMMKILNIQQPDDTTYEAIRNLLNKLPVVARSAIKDYLLKAAGDEDYPGTLRANLRWFLDRYGKE